MTINFSLRLDPEIKKKAMEAYEKNKHKYDSPSHFVRCAIIKQYRTDVGDE